MKRMLAKYHMSCVAVSITAHILTPSSFADHPKQDRTELFAKENMVAWCVVPFDAKNRSPEERAKMLKRLGFTKLAYDWRQKHVPTFEREILALKKHGIEFFAFWSEHPEMFRLFKKYKIHPQIWKIAASPQQGSQQDKIEASAKQLLPLVRRAAKLGCQVGIYNHGGWSGEPKNMIAICKWLRANEKVDHVGIVYNFHHGHQHIPHFAESLKQMMPYLLCVNLNGMNDGGNPKILPIGKGRHEKRMMQILKQTGYRGPIGILDHRADLDAEISLRENIVGLQNLLKDFRN